jgi:hypothetical protein
MGDGRTKSSTETQKIMKLLTDSAMNSLIESNGAFSSHVSPGHSASHPAAPFVRILEDDGVAAARTERSKARSGAATLGLAVFAVFAAGTLWGWAIMHLAALFLQVEALLLRNTFPLS